MFDFFCQEKWLQLVVWWHMSYFWPPLQCYPDDLLHAHTNFVDFRVCLRTTLCLRNYWVSLACLCIFFLLLCFPFGHCLQYATTKPKFVDGFGYLCMFMLVCVFDFSVYLVWFWMSLYVFVYLSAGFFFLQFATTKPHTSNTSRIYVHTVLVSIMYWSVIGCGLITEMVWSRRLLLLIVFALYLWWLYLCSYCIFSTLSVLVMFYRS